MKSLCLAWTALVALLGTPCAAAPSDSGLRRLEPPAAFVPNRGQWPEAVRYRMDQGGCAAWVVRDGWWLSLPAGKAGSGAKPAGVALRVTLEGGREAPGPSAERPLPGRCHYFLGQDPARWAAGVPRFERVAWRGLREGMDLVLLGGEGILRFDLHLAPGFDPSGIALRLAGHEALEVGEDGALRVHTACGVLEYGPPVAWYETPEGGRRPVACRFRRIDGARFGFDVLEPRLDLALVIDPALRWSSLLGGSESQQILAVARTAAGEAVVAGALTSWDFPITPGTYDPSYNLGGDAFVSRFDSQGQFLSYSTFLGGSGTDYASGVAVDAAGRVTVAGDTWSTDFPTLAGSWNTAHAGSSDAFVLRLDPLGQTLEYSGLLGGHGSERCNGLAVAPGGAAVVCGATASSGFPTTTGAYDRTYNGGQYAGDAFATRVAADGKSLDFSTFLGSFQEEVALDLALGPAEEVTLCGTTSSSSFPTTSGAWDRTFNGGSDGFASRLNAAGSWLLWSTFLGGEGSDAALAVALDPGGEVYLAGRTYSSSFPVTSGVLQPLAAGASEGFLSRLDPGAASLLASTYLGGSGEDEVRALLVDPGGNPIAAGVTTSDDWPVTPGTFDDTFNGIPGDVLTDAFVSRLGPDLAALEYSSFLGGSLNDDLQDMVWAPPDAVLMVGGTESSGFPVSPGAYQSFAGSPAISMGFASELRLLRHPVSYGMAKLTSAGSLPTLIWDGFPSLTPSPDFTVGVVCAYPLSPKAVLFGGLAPASTPFAGHVLLVQPPLKRLHSLDPDVFGYDARPIALGPSMVGQVWYYQVWSLDPGDPAGISLSNGLEVVIHP